MGFVRKTLLFCGVQGDPYLEASPYEQCPAAKVMFIKLIENAPSGVEAA